MHRIKNVRARICYKPKKVLYISQNTQRLYGLYSSCLLQLALGSDWVRGFKSTLLDLSSDNEIINDNACTRMWPHQMWRSCLARRPKSDICLQGIWTTKSWKSKSDRAFQWYRVALDVTTFLTVYHLQDESYALGSCIHVISMMPHQMCPQNRKHSDRAQGLRTTITCNLAEIRLWSMKVLLWNEPVFVLFNYLPLVVEMLKSVSMIHICTNDKKHEKSNIYLT